MKIFCNAIDDTYITNKITGTNSAEHSNVGKAGTLDLFKIYNEQSYIQNQYSRILIKFDLQRVRELLPDKININCDSFTANIKLFDVSTGHSVPERFYLSAIPLTKKFDEGNGRDVVKFLDLDIANFLTASVDEDTGNAIIWTVPGANYIGHITDVEIDGVDYITVDGSEINLVGKQFFKTGIEDLNIDVTSAISGALSNMIDDHGFVIAFSGSYQTDNKSRFVKRFVSRHSVNPQLRPRLEISYNDSIFDDRENSYVDSDNNLFLSNIVKGKFKNFISGSNNEEISGENCIKLILSHNEFNKEFFGSQIKAGSDQNFIDGQYKTNFLISKNELSEHFDLSGFDEKITLQEQWTSIDDSVIFYSGSIDLKIKNESYHDDNIQINYVNLQQEYHKNTSDNIRIFLFDAKKRYDPSRERTLQRKTIYHGNIHFRVRDATSGKLVFNFDKENNSTIVSYDKKSNYFYFDFSILNPGRTYKFEFLLNDNLNKILKPKEIFRILS
jgi:hypothetical protein